MTYIYKTVDHLPKGLDSGVVYHSEEFEVAALLCACGCGHRVSLLVPDSHQVRSDAGMATISPSISVCDAPCRSHYLIKAGKVEMLPAFTPAMAASTMRHQIARHAAAETKRATWRDRVKSIFIRPLRYVRSAFTPWRFMK